jgi:cation diffusion facilitator family transporter
MSEGVDPRAQSAPDRARVQPAVLRAGLVSLASSALLLALKLAAWLATDSAALLADALESIVNVVAAAFATYSVIVAARPADADHPYGHGKAEFVSAGLEGTLILLAASLILGESVHRLAVGSTVQRIDIGVLLASLGAAGNLALGLYLVRTGRSERSDAIEADGRHILTDVVTTLGAIAALLAVRATGLAWIDPLAGIAVALQIVRTGWRIVRRALAGLLDEADFGFLGEIAARLAASRRSDWCELHQLRAWRSGSFRHIDLHLVVPRYYTIEQAHATAAPLEDALLELVGGRGDVVVHLDPCRPAHCSACSVEDCPVRSTRLAEPFDYSLATLARPGRI